MAKPDPFAVDETPPEGGQEDGTETDGQEDDATLPAGGSDASGGGSSIDPLGLMRPSTEEELATQRRKTVKTAEALMRAFDDLNRLSRKEYHEDIIDNLAGFISLAKNWE